MSESVMMEIISIVCSALLIVSQIILIRGQNGQIPGHVAIRLSGESRYRGRVEVYYRNTWRSICHDYWNANAAQVVCRQLGYSESSGAQPLSGEASDNVYALDDLICHGNETSLDKCRHDPWGEHNCRQNEAAGVVCQGQAPVVRLAGGTTPSEGRVEVYHEYYWGSICDMTWNVYAADVICKQLGYSEGALHATTGFTFGEATGNYFLDQVSCTGNENYIDECAHAPWRVTSCTGTAAAGVKCKGEGVSIRLVGSPDPHRGRVEVYYRRQWGMICDDDWGIEDASVICRQLGYRYALRSITESQFGSSDSGIFQLDEVRCVGMEISIAGCDHLPWTVNNCGNTEAAGVICQQHDTLSIAAASTQTPYRITALAEIIPDKTEPVLDVDKPNKSDTMNTVTMNPVDISLTSHRIPALADDIPDRTLLVTDADEANTEDAVGAAQTSGDTESWFSTNKLLMTSLLTVGGLVLIIIIIAAVGAAVCRRPQRKRPEGDKNVISPKKKNKGGTKIENTYSRREMSGRQVRSGPMDSQFSADSFDVTSFYDEPGTYNVTGEMESEKPAEVIYDKATAIVDVRQQTKENTYVTAPPSRQSLHYANLHGGVQTDTQGGVQAKSYSNTVQNDQFEKPVYTNMTVTPQLDQHVSVPVGRPGQDYVNI